MQVTSLPTRTNVVVWRVAGLQAELFYVREGVVNTYAMNFVVPVPAHISELEFSWQSLTKHPVSTYMKHRSEVKLRGT
jgi:RYK receptor-like tyrosine kinase